MIEQLRTLIRTERRLFIHSQETFCRAQFLNQGVVRVRHCGDIWPATYPKIPHTRVLWLEQCDPQFAQTLLCSRLGYANQLRFCILDTPISDAFRKQMSQEFPYIFYFMTDATKVGRTGYDFHLTPQDAVGLHQTFVTV